jgi:ESCRT-II complex subunit VPS25
VVVRGRAGGTVRARRGERARKGIIVVAAGVSGAVRARGAVRGRYSARLALTLARLEPRIDRPRRSGLLPHCESRVRGERREAGVVHRKLCAGFIPEARLEMEGFSPPELWRTFPPFFTLQPVDATRAAQLDEWRKLLVAHCAHLRAPTLVLRAWPLLENRELQRRLSDEGAAAVAEAVIRAGCGEWADAPQCTTLRIFWRSPAEWAQRALAYMRDAGRTGAGNAGAFASVFELRGGGGSGGSGGGDAASLLAGGAPLADLDADSAVRVLELLADQGRLVFVAGAEEDGDPDKTTVKFL